MKTWVVSMASRSVKVDADRIEFQESGAIAFYNRSSSMPIRGFGRDQWIEFEEVRKQSY